MVLACRFRFKPCWVLLFDGWYRVPHVLLLVWHVGCCHGTEPCNRGATVRLLLRFRRHLVSDALVLSLIFHLTRDDSNGVLQPYKHLGWWKWMYRVSPYTYVVEGLVGQGGAFHPLPICFCADAVFSGWAA
jgi:hypothetical protein